jgi:membrane protease YdiL (CAAX protease family)
MAFKSHIYAVLPEDAKPVSGPWSFLQVPLLMLLSLVIFGAIGAIIGVVVMMMQNPDIAERVSQGGEMDAEILAQMMNYLLPGYVIGAFGGMFAVSFLKTGPFEKRRLDTIGLGKFLYGGPFWGWLLIGILFAVAVSASSHFIGGFYAAPTEVEPVDWSILQNNSVYIGFGILFLLLLIQAPAEEVFFRGWLMSAISARNGVFWGVALSSFLFMAPHFFNTMGATPALTLYSLLSVGSLGLLFAAISIAKGSIIPAAGFHTGYNFLLFSGALIQGMVTTGETNFGQMLMEMFNVSNMPEVTMDDKYWADLGARLAITLLPAIYFFTRKKES